MYRMDLVPTKELREMAAQVLHVEEKDCWPGDGEVPKWVREMGREMEKEKGEPVTLYSDAFVFVPQVCARVRHEVLRRFVCEPQRLQ